MDMYLEVILYSSAYCKTAAKLLNAYFRYGRVVKSYGSVKVVHEYESVPPKSAASKCRSLPVQQGNVGTDHETSLTGVRPNMRELHPEAENGRGCDGPCAIWWKSSSTSARQRQEDRTSDTASAGLGPLGDLTCFGVMTSIFFRKMIRKQ